MAKKKVGGRTGAKGGAKGGKAAARTKVAGRTGAKGGGYVTGKRDIAASIRLSNRPRNGGAGNKGGGKEA